MRDDKMIIKALRCCVDDECTSCPMRDVSLCMDKLHRSTIDLIKRQKAEIEECLNQRHGKWEISCDGWYPYCSECGQEPKGGMSKYCPNCGAKMDLGGDYCDQTRSD